MSLQSVLEKLKAKKTVERASEWQEYKRKVLLPLARSEEIDADECQVFMERLGKSESDLRSDVERLQRRISARAQLEQAKKNFSRLQVIEAELEKMDQEFFQVRQAHERKRSPLISELSSIRGLSDFNYCANDLQRTILNPALTEAIAKNLEARKVLYPRREWLRTQLTRNADGGEATIRYMIATTEEKIAELEGPSAIRRLGDSLLAHVTKDTSEIEKRAKIAELKVRLQELVAVRSRYEAELDDLERQHAALLSEEKVLLEQTLEP